MKIKLGHPPWAIWRSPMYFDPFDNVLGLASLPEENVEGNVERMIGHETIHATLVRLEGFSTSAKLDVIHSKEKDFEMERKETP